jgi:hypothetical protein
MALGRIRWAGFLVCWSLLLLRIANAQVRYKQDVSS